jgi:hypothetical protein
MTEEAMRQALEEARGSHLVVPEGTVIEPSTDSLALAIGAMTLDELGGCWGHLLDVRARMLLARDRIAAAVRTKRCVPLVDDQNNVVGWRFAGKETS